MPRTTYSLPADLDQLLRTANYPGMIPEESRPLRGFLRYHGREFGEVRFNVRVGAPAEAGADASDQVRAVWRHVTRMRVDMLGWRAPDQATIVEAKSTFGNDAVWQLLAYRDAYRAEYPAHQLRLVGVAELAGPTAIALARTHGIALYLYTFAPGVVDVTAPATEGGNGGI